MGKMKDKRGRNITEEIRGSDEEEGGDKKKETGKQEKRKRASGRGR